MLAYVLALAVGLGSLAIYLAAFFFPEIHRKNDFIWSGVGLLYALVLWVCAGRITGGLLLGQTAGVALLGWSVTQTLSLRRQVTPRQQQTELPSAEEVKNTVQEKVSNLSLPQRLSQLQQRVTGSVTGVKDRVQETLTKTTTKQKTPLAETTQPPTMSTAPTAATGEAMPAAIVANAPLPPPIDAIEQDEDDSRVQIIDKRIPIIDPPADIAATEQLRIDTVSPTTSVPEVLPPNSPEPDAEIEPALTEEEAIALAVETTLTDAATAEASIEAQEGSVPEPVRPNPPDPEIIEAAIRDAEEKHQQATPPHPDQPENPSQKGVRGEG